MSVATGTRLNLPGADGSLTSWSPGPAPELPAPDHRPPRTRACLAAAHVVADPSAPGDPVAAPAVDWEATMAYRRHLWSHGVGVADAMDTAQRGGALGWPLARELIRQSAAESRATGGQLACGAATDQLEPDAPASLDSIRDAYLEQCELIEAEGATVVVMASRHLAAAAERVGDYRGCTTPCSSGRAPP